MSSGQMCNVHHIARMTYGIGVTENTERARATPNSNNLPGGKCGGFRISSTKNSPIPIKLHTKINSSIFQQQQLSQMHAHNITVNSVTICWPKSFRSSSAPLNVICSMPTWKMFSMEHCDIVFIQFRLKLFSNCSGLSLRKRYSNEKNTRTHQMHTAYTH